MSLRLVHSPLVMDERGIAWHDGLKWLTLSVICDLLDLPFWRVARDASRRLNPRLAVLPSGSVTHVYALTEVQLAYARERHEQLRVRLALPRPPATPPLPSPILRRHHVHLIRLF